jgi:hypothetical protein
VRSWQIVIMVCAVLLTLGLTACGHEKGHDEDVSMSVPIHMEVPTTNLQPKMGLSGFIFGTFLMMGAYIVMIVGCVLLIIKDRAMKQFLTFAGLAGQMFNPKFSESMVMAMLNRLSSSETRMQFGAVGLIAGVILAYFGAWVAM